MDGGLGGLPFSSVSDVVTHGDFAAVFRVVSERDFTSADVQPRWDGSPGTTPPVTVDDGFRVRVVEVAVESLVWDSGRIAVPDVFEFVSDGWQLDGDDRLPVTGASGVRLIVDGRYFAVFAGFGSDIGPMHPVAVYQLEGTRLTRPAATSEQGGTRGPAEFEGAQLAEIDVLLAEAVVGGDARPSTEVSTAITVEP